MNAPNGGPFSILTAPVRRWARRDEPQTTSKPVQARAAHSSASHPMPVPEMQSEVISAFQLQHVQLPDALERASRGAAIGARTAITLCAFTLASVIGAGMWWVNRPVTRADLASSSVNTSTVGPPTKTETTTHLGAPAIEAPRQAVEIAPQPARAERDVPSSSQAQQPQESPQQRPQVNTPVRVLNPKAAPASSPIERSVESDKTANEFSTAEPLSQLTAADPTPSATVPPTSVSSPLPVTERDIPRVYRMKSEETDAQGN